MTIAGQTRTSSASMSVAGLSISLGDGQPCREAAGGVALGAALVHGEQAGHGNAPARSLVLSPLAGPRGAQQISKQSVALLVVARVNVVDHPHHERRGGFRVKGPAVRFHHVAGRANNWSSCITCR